MEGKHLLGLNLSLSQLRPHHLPYATIKVHLRTLTPRQLQSGEYSYWDHSYWDHSYWDPFLLGSIPTGYTFLPGYIPPSLNGFYSKQHLTGEQHVTLLVWHVLLQTVKLKAKGLKGILKKTNFFFLITIFRASELTYNGSVDIKSSNAYSLDSLPLL